MSSKMDNKRVDAKERSGAALVPIREGLFRLPSSPSEKPRLIGNKCRSCGESFFPSRACCRRCSSQDMEEIVFSPIAKLHSFTCVRVKSPHLITAVPYISGVVELEGGDRVRTLLTDCDMSSLEIGMDMEVVIESVGKAVERMGTIEVGQEMLGWKFRPVRGKK